MQKKISFLITASLVQSYNYVSQTRKPQAVFEEIKAYMHIEQSRISANALHTTIVYRLCLSRSDK